MGFFDFIKRRKSNDFDDYIKNRSIADELNNTENEFSNPSKELFTASDNELKSKKNMENNNISLIQKIIIEINLFCSRDLESKGFQDCVQNSDMLNKEMNRKLLQADFKKLIENSISQLDNRVFYFKHKINTYESAGMTESSSKFNSYVEEYERFKNELSEFIEDENKQKEKIKFILLSYEIGFNNGLKNNDNELI